MTRSSDRELPTPAGPARVVVSSPDDAPAVARLVLGHGAGGGIEAPDLVVLARRLPAYGIEVTRVEQPWRLQGRKVATAPPTLDLAWNAVVPALDGATPLFVGGRSAGARVACRTAAGLGAAGCLALAFPLHPPGRPERSRLPELLGAAVDTLVVQGERDSFGRPEEFPEGIALRRVAGADHSFAVPARSSPGRAALLASLADDVAAWVLAVARAR